MNRQYGFTLLELLIVLGLVAVCAGRGWHYSTDYQHRLQLDAESKRLMHWLINIAVLANQSNTNYVIQLHTQAENWHISSKGRLFVLAKQCAISDYSQQTNIVFYGKRNMAQPGHITVSNPKGHVRVIVSTRGRIRRCDERGGGLFGLPSC